MAEASIDIRIFPNKELTSVDMAEIVDAAIFNTGVIQGCELTLVNGVFHITDGRLIVGGRLGVVTGGTIPNPTTLTKKEGCWPLAVCDLSSTERPFYFLIATEDDLHRLGLDTEQDDENFNIHNGIRCLDFGYCQVDPATGLASDYEAWGQATARRGWDWYNQILGNISQGITNAIQSATTWQLLIDRDIPGSENNWIPVPDGVKEIYVAVFIQWTGTQKICVDFHIPIVGHLFNPTTGAAQTSHVNYWGKDNNGFVRIGTNRYNDKYYVRLLEAYNKETNVLNKTYYRVYCR